MGMFFLTRNVIKAIDIFPQDLPTKICADFTCKGRECTRESCPYSHPRNARKLPTDTIAAIACHFSTKKIGWLNEWHFMKLAHLPPDVKALVGGKDGPSSSKRAWLIVIHISLSGFVKFALHCSDYTVLITPLIFILSCQDWLRHLLLRWCLFPFQMKLFFSKDLAINYITLLSSKINQNPSSVLSSQQALLPLPHLLFR